MNCSNLRRYTSPTQLSAYQGKTRYTGPKTMQECPSCKGFHLAHTRDDAGSLRIQVELAIAEGKR